MTRIYNRASVMISKQAFIMNESTMMFRDVSGWNLYGMAPNRPASRSSSTSVLSFVHPWSVTCSATQAREARQLREGADEGIDFEGGEGASLRGSPRLHRLGICINRHIHAHARARARKGLAWRGEECNAPLHPCPWIYFYRLRCVYEKKEIKDLRALSRSDF